MREFPQTQLLAELQERDGLAYLFISHDLAVVRRVAHRTGVLRDGRGSPEPAVVDLGVVRLLRLLPA